MARRPGPASLRGRRLLEILQLDAGDEPVPDVLLEAVPDPDFEVDAYMLTGVPRAVPLRDGDVLDLGDRRLSVLHLPGHTPGSINLWDADAGHVFTGDVIYEGGLIDSCAGSDIGSYLTTMGILADLPLTRAFPGHGRILDRREVRTIAADYVASRAD